MAYFPHFRLLAFSCLGLSLPLLNGCCANNVCERDDSLADAIVLRFSKDTVSATGRGFHLADLDTIILRRYPYPYDAKTTKFDSVTLIRNRLQARDSIVLNNSTPFAQVNTSTKLNAYAYEVLYLMHPPKRGARTRISLINKVLLEGVFEGDGCCTYYTNTRKEVFVNGEATSRNLSTNNVLVLEK